MLNDEFVELVHADRPAFARDFSRACAR